jgi:hypothetical protein
MLEPGSDAEILAGAQVTVRLCGESFTFNEPKRRQARAMLAELIPLQARANSGDPAVVIVLVNDVLDWLYRWNADMRRAKDRLDEATEPEIMDAFRAVADMVTAPFARLAVSIKDGSAAQENTTSRPPTS